MADKGNRVVVRINYDKDRRRKELIDPKMVTVWHKGRIFSAIAILLLLIGFLFFLFSGEEAKENKPLSLKNDEQSKSIESVQKEEISVPKLENNKVSPEPLPSISPVKTSLSVKPKKSSSATVSSKRPPAIIFDSRVIRASLNKEPRYGEPGDPIKPRVVIGLGQSIEAFYFSEIKNMKHRVLLHHWFKNGELVYKKHFDVETDKFKLISSKKLSAKDVGEWSVALIDQKGKRFSEVNFSVNP